MKDIQDEVALTDRLISNCDKDYEELVLCKIDEDFFEDHINQRLVNSFLFSFTKIQDKMGAKVFKKLLIALKEIDTESVPMLDVLNLLEKLHIIDDVHEWEKIRELRNNLSHEYFIDIQMSIENIRLSLGQFARIKEIFFEIKQLIQTRIQAK